MTALSMTAIAGIQRLTGGRFGEGAKELIGEGGCVDFYIYDATRT
ncbi:MAG: hypothetical protein ACM3NQ_24040 [Bacteroidales bacterium]